MTQSQYTEQGIGFWLAVGTVAVGSILLLFREPVILWFFSSPEALRRFDAITAGVMAYGFYVAADCMSAAEWPQFLRDHLFDGLVPAALVGFLILSLPRDDPQLAFPLIQKPWKIFVLFYLAGALIFGLIAAAAVFSSAGKDYGDAIYFCAAFGGLMFPLAYFRAVLDYIPGSQIWRWWFTKRPDEVYDDGQSKRWEHTLERSRRIGAAQRARVEAQERARRDYR
jgi:hypothetical protein